jgi:hypothetical protein
MFTEDDAVEITCKIHGTNARYGIIKKTKLSLWDRFKKLIRIADKWIDYEFIYGSHNVEKGSDTQGFYDTDVWRTIADDNKIKKNLWEYVDTRYTPKDIGTGFIIYGEIYGKGIQKNYEYGLDTIMQLNPVQFEYIDTYKNYGEGLQIGNIAQDVEKIIPEAVFVTPSTGLKGIDYNQFNGIYIKAIQDQQKIIKDLIERIEQLENKYFI